MDAHPYHIVDLSMLRIVTGVLDGGGALFVVWRRDVNCSMYRLEAGFQFGSVSHTDLGLLAGHNKVVLPESSH